MFSIFLYFSLVFLWSGIIVSTREVGISFIKNIFQPLKKLVKRFQIPPPIKQPKEKHQKRISTLLSPLLTHASKQNIHS